MTRKAQQTKILIVNDMQVGSKYALMPEKWRDDEGEQFYPNEIQSCILKKWNEMCEKEKDVNYLILNGEGIDGVQAASRGREVWTTDLSTQIDAAEELLKRIEYDKLLVTYGSIYHTDANLNADQMLAKQLGATKSGWEINFRPKGTGSTFHLSHEIGVSTSVAYYRTTAIARELVAALLQQDELYKYDVIVRSHAHYFVMVRFSKQIGLVTPCWQARTPYMVRKGLSLVPKLGYVVLENDGDVMPWRVRVETFNIPRPELTEV